LESPIFDPVSGFGGNGKKVPGADPLKDHCLFDGPFANRTLRIGPYGKMVTNNTRCLRRNLNPRVAEINASKKVLSRILKSKTYADFCLRISGAGVLPPKPGQPREFLGDLHSVGHGGIGGEVGVSPFKIYRYTSLTLRADGRRV
jgi:hypothetical protein